MEWSCSKESYELVFLIASAFIRIHGNTFLLQSSGVTWSPLGWYSCTHLAHKASDFPHLMALRFRYALWYFLTALVSCQRRISFISGGTRSLRPVVRGRNTVKNIPIAGCVGGVDITYFFPSQQTEKEIQYSAWLGSFTFGCNLLKIIWMLILSITNKDPEADHSVKYFSQALPQMPLSPFQHALH